MGFIPTNPAHGVKPPRPAPGRVRYLQPGELRVVLEAAPMWLRPIIALAVSTGMRRSEILGLRWLDVDFTGARVLLSETKNGESRVVYLNRLAIQAIESLHVSNKTKPTGLLFPGLRPEWVSVAFSRLCRRLKIENFHLHDLRHTAASWLRMKGADIHTVALLLGHKDLRMAARYQHLSPTFSGGCRRPAGRNLLGMSPVCHRHEGSIRSGNDKCLKRFGVPDGI